MIKPLVGVLDDGPGDASVVLPGDGLDAGAGDRVRDQPAVRPARPLRDGRLRDRRGRAELREPSAPTPPGSRSSTTSAGATPSGPRRWGSLVRAAEGCRDVALAYGTPFISGKDSLYNEYSHEGQSLAIPGTLADQRDGPLVARRPQVRDDGFEGAGERACSSSVRLGMSWEARTGRWSGDWQGGVGPSGRPRKLRPGSSGRSMRPSSRGLVRSCHDLSEGGDGRGPGRDGDRGRDWARRSTCSEIEVYPLTAARGRRVLFSESPTRFILEIRTDDMKLLVDRCPCSRA